MTTQGGQGRWITLAIMAFLVALITIASNCHGQANSKQYQVRSVCVDKVCSKVKVGTIAITDKNLYITIDGIREAHRILHYFPYRGVKKYRIEGKHFDGWMTVTKDYAQFEIYKTLVNYNFRQ